MMSVCGARQLGVFSCEFEKPSVISLFPLLALDPSFVVVCDRLLDLFVHLCRRCCHSLDAQSDHGGQLLAQLPLVGHSAALPLRTGQKAGSPLVQLAAHSHLCLCRVSLPCSASWLVDRSRVLRSNPRDADFFGSHADVWLLRRYFMDGP